MTDRLESRMVEAVERIAAAVERNAAGIEGLLAIEERKLGAGTKALDIAARQERDMEGRPVIELVNTEKPGPA